MATAESAALHRRVLEAADASAAFGRLAVQPGMRFDARGGVVVESLNTLFVADLHLGYAEAQQRRGNLMASSESDVRTLARVAAMTRDHACERVVLLGDLQHEFGLPRDGEVAAVTVLAELIEAAGAELVFVLGNHDRGLSRWLDRVGWPHDDAFIDEAARIHAVHGDRLPSDRLPEVDGTLIVGHFHPAITLHDGCGARLRMNCFLVNDRYVMLPAMNAHSTGVNVLAPHPPVPPLLRENFAPLAIDAAGDGLTLRPLKKLHALRGW